MFELPYTDETTVVHYVDEFYKRMVAEKRIDVFVEKKDGKASKSGKDLQMIDLNSIRNKDVCEVTGYDTEHVTKDRLYAISKKLYAEKEALEQHLSVRTNELFDIQDKIILYDLTNTYFEGRKQGSKLAKFGRGKEKRGDAKLVVLGLVINPEGFIKYSSILEGNMADSKTLEGMINKLRIKTSSSAREALVVIDAGIATDDNLKMILDNGYDYLRVSRSCLKDYNIEAGMQQIAGSLTKKGGVKQEEKVHKSELDQCQFIEQQLFNSG